MNTNRIQNIILRIVGKQSITVQDVTDLQHGVEEGGFVTREEAEALFLVERMVPTACASWGVFFIEALTAHLVWERRPAGKVLADDVAWLSHTLALPRTGPARHIGPLLVSRCCQRRWRPTHSSSPWLWPKTPTMPTSCPSATAAARSAPLRSLVSALR